MSFLLYTISIKKLAFFKLTFIFLSFNLLKDPPGLSKFAKASGDPIAFISNGVYGSWTSPVCITGKDGEAGTDIADKEQIYKTAGEGETV